MMLHTFSKYGVAFSVILASTIFVTIDVNGETNAMICQIG